jgi:hypothetical protein
MKCNTLTTTSLIAAVLMTFHITDDIVRGISPPSLSLLSNVIGPLIFVVWLIGPLMLAERRSGLVIMLLGGVFAAAMPVLHMRGAGYLTLVASDGGFFFVWTLYGVGVTGALSIILAARALWLSRTGSRRGQHTV